MPTPSARSPLHVHADGGIARVRIDHPPINLLDLALSRELDVVSRELATAADIRVVIFESALPDYFLSHADLGLLQRARAAGVYADVSQLGFYQQILERLRTMPKATIGIVEGRARGGGAELALALDMVFASPAARFSQMEVMLGINPGGGGAQYLARKAGRSRALELCLGGGDVGADLAVAYGYANRVLPAAELGPFVDRLAQAIASYPAEAIAANKANVLVAEPPHEAGLLDAHGKFATLVASTEFDRRVAAFLSAGGHTADGERDDPMAFAERLAN